MDICKYERIEIVEAFEKAYPGIDKRRFITREPSYCNIETRIKYADFITGFLEGEKHTVNILSK